MEEDSWLTALAKGSDDIKDDDRQNDNGSNNVVENRQDSSSTRNSQTTSVAVVFPRINHRTAYKVKKSRPSIESNGTEYEEIGQGGFGRFSCATGSLSKTKSGIKTIPILAHSSQELKAKEDRAEYELSVQASLPPHLNLVRFFYGGVVQGVPKHVDINDLNPQRYPFSSFVNIEMEMCTGGNLWQLIESNSQSRDARLENFSTEAVAQRMYDLLGLVSLFEDVVVGVYEMHRVNVIHRDLKPANVFLVVHDGHCRAKVGDFGHSVRLGDYPFIGGTDGWSAPEQMAELGKEQWQRSYPATANEKAADIFPLGIMLASVIWEEPSTPQVKRRLELTRKQFAERWNLDFGIPDEHINHDVKMGLFRLIADMTKDEPSQRPTIAQVKSRLADLISDIKEDYDTLVDRSGNNLDLTEDHVAEEQQGRDASHASNDVQLLVQRLMLLNPEQQARIQGMECFQQLLQATIALEEA